ncbi:MAG: DUF342 domain-containing protein [Phycisphaerales bacterium]|nr:FapA family protein [Phycisphaerae bacterium]NNF43345.1 DUF342 domain-containing protein [Phycisphaerales bacterium]NNM27737.1 DUF342 domain-containing protein [Phycisphaerales bacterium]
MTSKTTHPGINVAISADRLTASLMIRANVERTAVTVRTLTDRVESSGIRVDDTVRGRLEQLVRRAELETGEVEGIIADVRTRNAGIEWATQFDPTVTPKETKKTGDVDHYVRSTFVKVKTGDEVAAIRPSPECLDVLGEPFPDDATTTGFTFDDVTFCVRDDGAVVANMDGVVLIEGTVVFVSRRLEIPKCVDFSTGNIDFDGSVYVGDGVKDRFVVTAAGDIAVDGLIEGATINAGGSLCCARGMAAKDRGTINVAHHVDIGFLNNVRGAVGRNLNVRGEIMNCHLQVARDLVCPTGAIIGGEVSVTGKVELGMLGSPRVIPTTLIAGVGGQPAEDLARVNELLAEMSEEIEQRANHFEMMQESVDDMTAAQRKDHEEFGLDLQETKARFAALKARRENTASAIGKRRTFDVRVKKQIHPGAVLVVDGVAWRFERELAGPVEVFLDDEQQVVYRGPSGVSWPISEVATVATDAA